MIPPGVVTKLCILRSTRGSLTQSVQRRRRVCEHRDVYGEDRGLVPISVVERTLATGPGGYVV